MSDVEEFSHAARLGGLRTETINKFIATKAALNVLGPPTNTRQVNKTQVDMVGRFNRWLRQAGESEEKFGDRELRRYVLLMVTEGRTGNGQVWADDEVAARILNFAEDMYRSINIG